MDPHLKRYNSDAYLQRFLFYLRAVCFTQVCYKFFKARLGLILLDQPEQSNDLHLLSLSNQYAFVFSSQSR